MGLARPIVSKLVPAVARTKLIAASPGRWLCTTALRFQQDEKERRVERPESMKRSTGKGDPFRGRGPITWVNFAATGVVMAVLLGSYYYIRGKKEARLDLERRKEIGKTKIGGRFELIDHNGQKRTSEDFLGKWVLLYFGFTHCPDICPDEIEKMVLVVDKVTEAMKDEKDKLEIVPLFISVDPVRDGVEEVAKYVKEFHPRLIGLTGSEEQVKEACKAFRVYFSAGPRDDENDYIVDHSIIVFLLDPKNSFVDYYGQTKNAEMIASSVILHMGKYQQYLKSKSSSLFG
jgi:protein SCO1/2